jgi:hypothetical protein
MDLTNETNQYKHVAPLQNKILLDIKVRFLAYTMNFVHV